MVTGMVSVVVAVYNTGKYLNRCVESILAQSYNNLEILLIDDGSTDDSSALCDSFAAKDSRVKVIHKINEGLSVARNTALEIAQGEYVSFIDSDDKLSEYLFENAIAVMEKENADMVKYNYCICEEELSLVKEISEYYIMSAQEITEKILVDGFGSQLWQYLFKKSLWADIISPAGRLAQDMMTLHLASSKTNKAVVIKDNLYYYYQDRTDNVSNSNKKGVRGTVDRSYAYWLRTEFCLKNADYKNMFEECFNKAVSYTVSCFCNKDLFEQQRYESDRILFRDNIKKYIKKILSSAGLSFDRKICALMIVVAPRIVSKFFKIIRRGN